MTVPAGREARTVFATARRVLGQLAHDLGTVALILALPCVLLILLRWVFHGVPGSFARAGPQLFGVFPLIVMYLVASVATLRERVNGTLDRLLCLPMRRLDLLLGYVVAFGVLAVAQAGVATGLAVGVLGMRVAGPVWLLLLAAALDALLGLALGLLTSAFARTEFQAVQYLPAVILPQFLLCGLFVPPEAMDGTLRLLADTMPMTYAVQATSRIATEPGITSALLADLVAVTAFLLACLILGAFTLRRRTP
ncbi:ABC-2 type transport system permease protein [Lentzea atacamensis]|uniref:Transport permease protein n=1 Tax=Lentzea atacamensis TaxID=531938 RepID=A0A316HF43_9PSEU|nr:ABC transporter permease [Lentzea atacamensis]PWK78620.1 ABC-2 type transport system permease protein [Lentzea atacamensis]